MRTNTKDVKIDLGSADNVNLQDAVAFFRMLRNQLTPDLAQTSGDDELAGDRISQLLDLLVDQPPDNASRRADMVRRVRSSWISSQAQLDTLQCDAILDAISRVPREEFVPDEVRELAYLPTPLTIGHDQTISDPLLVATLALAVSPHQGAKVLDVGTGCGYQAAVLSLLCGQIVSVEIIPKLAEEASARLRRLGYSNVHVIAADAVNLHFESQQFDAVVIAAGSSAIPAPLLQCLKIQGRLIAPVGPQSGNEQLICVTRTGERDFRSCSLGRTRFVPLQGVAARTIDRDKQPISDLPFCFGGPILTASENTGQPDGR